MIKIKRNDDMYPYYYGQNPYPHGQYASAGYGQGFPGYYNPASYGYGSPGTYYPGMGAGYNPGWYSQPTPPAQSFSPPYQPTQAPTSSYLTPPPTAGGSGCGCGG
ncbi:hypothetical protein A374_13520 [Fictibacillus macauensis ZFHKF-1]|uniref:Uncharacterized protein n=1 Tax=Fictibacillus macauensis ZFHKF-1 TaxID=1196324 RepID=I8AH09_9BACL|nr:hypothetical protein [Fictibacillus macauensis]EIT84714.1 hypothetical protein A374_13520 [Fictibacillus macauensis ZFHKF-1]